ATARLRFQQFQAEAQDLALHRDVERLAARIAEREIGEHESRHARVFDDIACGAEEHGRDSIRFEVARYQTHGLVAYGSDGCQYRDVDLVLDTSAQHLGRVAL